MTDWPATSQANSKDHRMMSLVTLAIGMTLFGLFYSLVIACDRL